MNKPRIGMDKRVSQLPNWLWSNSNVLPPIYKRIWESVREENRQLSNSSGNSGEPLVDTMKIFPLLLTSQLPTEVLGYIWSLANQKYSGKLTEQELYVVLALVSVAQTSYPFTNLEVLHLLPGPQTPRLNLTSIYPNTSQTTLPQDAPLRFEDFTKIPSKSQPKTTGITPPIIPGLIANNSHMGETKIDSKLSTNLTNTTETKNSSVSTASIDSDDFSEFQSAPIVQPSVSILETKQGSAIGSRLANHNLAVKKISEKPKKYGITSKNHGTQLKIQQTTAVSTQGNKESMEKLGELFPKCSLKTQQKMVILKDTVIRNDSTKQIVGNVRDNIVKIDIPTLTKQPPKYIPNIGNSTIRENSAQDLMNLQQIEDKYSALRILVEPNTDETSDEIRTNSVAQIANQSNDDFGDFGDFVSAEQTETNEKVVDNSDDIFNDFERFRPTNTGKKIGNFGEIAGTYDPQSLDGIGETDKIKVQKEDAISVNSIELINGATPLSIMTRSNSVPSLDLKSFLSPGVEDEHQQVENMPQLIYWEWKRYMESCVLLLQTAANVFGSITSDSVLQEVLASAQGYNFLCNLAEVAAVCRRVNFSHKEMDINIMGFDDLLMDIDKIWSEMEPFYASIPIVTELPVWPLHHNESTTCCSLCLTVVTSGRIIYNDNNYHVTCANLWLNCVNGNLPILRYPPSSYISQHSIPISSTSGSQI